MVMSSPRTPGIDRPVPHQLLGLRAGPRAQQQQQQHASAPTNSRARSSILCFLPETALGASALVDLFHPPTSALSSPHDPPPPPAPVALRSTPRTSAPSIAHRQNCAQCRKLRTCWSDQLDDAQIQVSLLTCRILRNIDRNQATKQLLTMIRPKTLQISKYVARTVGSRFPRDIRHDLESFLIEALLRLYRHGPIHPLHYLFGRPNGVALHWARHYVVRHYSYARAVYLYGTTATAALERHPGSAYQPAGDFEKAIRVLNIAAGNYTVTSSPLDASVPAPESTLIDTAERLSAAEAILDDGLTLPLHEYRVLRFCLANARSAPRKGAVRGLQNYLADQMGVSRRVVCRLFARASQRLVDATGMTERRLAAVGLPLQSATARSFRSRWRARPSVGKAAHLTPTEIADIVEFARTAHSQPEHASGHNIPWTDIAWACGVGTDRLRVYWQRYGHLSRDEILTKLRKPLKKPRDRRRFRKAPTP